MSMIKYKAFTKVVELGSYTAAARVLEYSQPGIHHMIDSLEKEFGFPLLVKGNKQLLPTEDGKKVLTFCYQIIRNQEYLDATVASIKGLTSGSIKIGAYNSLLVDFVPDVITNFSQAYSGVDIHVTECPYGSFFEDLPRQKIDIGFMNESRPDGFDFIHLFDDPAVVAMPDNHPLATYNQLPISVLNGCNMIEQSSGYDDIVQAVKAKENFKSSSHIYCASDCASYKLIANGCGISIISKLQARNLPAGTTFRPFNVDIHRRLGIVVKDPGQVTPAIREFVRVSRETAKTFCEKYDI